MLDLGLFFYLAYLMTLMALKATTDVIQGVANVNLGVKATMAVKKSAKTTVDVKPLKSTLIRSVD